MFKRILLFQMNIVIFVFAQLKIINDIRFYIVKNEVK